jgi:iron complex transport system ATP-binding protein
VLELDGIGFRYHGGDWVFRGVSLTVPAGSVTVVLGPNGTGKTTLVRCAAGLLTPVEGVVRRQGAVGFVPQARSGAFAYKVLDMVLMGRSRQIGLFGTPGRADTVAAVEALDRVGILDLRDRPFPTLSGGEQQLVLVARAVAAEAPILALDEPSTALDLHNQARVLTLLRKLVADGLAVLMTTHHPDHALYLADSVVLMVGVDDVRTGTAAALLTDETLTDLYGVQVSTLTYQHDGTDRRVIVTGYDDPYARWSQRPHVASPAVAHYASEAAKPLDADGRETG